MACAKNIKQCWRKYRLDEDFERPAAYQSRVVFGILVEIEAERARLLRLHHFPRGLPYVSLDATAANRAHDRAVVADQHFSGLERRNRPSNVDDGRDGTAAPRAPQLDNLLVDIHLSTIIRGWRRQVNTSVPRNAADRGALLGCFRAARHSTRHSYAPKGVDARHRWIALFRPQSVRVPYQGHERPSNPSHGTTRGAETWSVPAW